MKRIPGKQTHKRKKPKKFWATSSIPQVEVKIPKLLPPFEVAMKDMIRLGHMVSQMDVDPSKALSISIMRKYELLRDNLDDIFFTALFNGKMMSQYKIWDYTKDKQDWINMEHFPPELQVEFDKMLVLLKITSKVRMNSFKKAIVKYKSYHDLPMDLRLKKATDALGEQAYKKRMHL